MWCETDWSSADFKASLWRATSAERVASATRSRARACPIWSAAAARSRVSVRSGSPASRARSAQTEPRGSPLASIRTWYESSPLPLLGPGAGRCTRTHLAGASPGMRCSTRIRVGTGLLDAEDVSAVVRSPPASGPRATRTRSMRVRSRSRSTILARAARVDSLVASTRLTAYSAVASRSRAWAVSARVRCMAVSCPTTTPTNSSRTTLRSTPGSRIANVYSGSVNRKL